MIAIPQSQAILFKSIMDSLSPVNQAVLRCTLAHLPDDRFNAINMHLKSASPGHLRHYIYILGAHDSTNPKPSKTIAYDSFQQQKANDARVLSSEQLRVGFQKLPKEIRDAIESAFIKSALTPGFVFLDRAPGPNGKHFFLGNYFEPTKYEVLLGLNRATYQLHGRSFWSNYFVVGNGPASYSMHSLRRMHKDVRAKIRKVYISLSRDDKPNRAAHGAEYIASNSYHQGVVSDPVELMHKFDTDTVRLNARIKWRWCEKMMYLSHLQLENLIIDVRDAFGVDDSFLGDSFMPKVPQFSKKPQKVEILANDDETAVALLSMFWAQNS